MCEGGTQERHPTPNSELHLRLKEPTVSAHLQNDNTNNDYYCGSTCELCGSLATLYCQADDAYLCAKCDSWVHGANFLANRHVRCLLCHTCHRFSHRFLVGMSRHLDLPELVVGGKRSIQSHCDGQYDCSSLRMLKPPFLFL